MNALLSVLSKKAFLVSTASFCLLTIFCLNFDRPTNSSQNSDSPTLPRSSFPSKTLDQAFTPPKPIGTEKSLADDEEWCATDDFSQLLNDPVFPQFLNWVTEFEEGNDKEPLPKNFLDRGLELSIKRAKHLKTLIRFAPASALSLAISPERISKLPEEVSLNMESWHSDEVSLRTLHVCFNPKMPKGMIKRWATFPNGQTFQAHVYGKRAFLPTMANLPISGISLDGSLAISEYPFRIVSELPDNKSLLEYAGRNLEVDRDSGLDAIRRMSWQADLKGLSSGRFDSPIIASSLGGSTNLINLRYELVTTPMNWADANQTAFNRKGRLVCINSASENNIVYQLLKDAMSLGLLPDGSGAVQHSWIGATDYEDQNGSYFDKDANITRPLEVNASEGNWHWLSNEDVSLSAYQNWAGGAEPANANADFGAMDWTTTDAKWIDLNASYRLPFVIEYDVDLTPSPTSLVNGKRKVLVFPTRFRDEGNNFSGSSSNPTDPFGNPTGTSQNQGAFEPDSRENLIAVMNQVKEFYLRNSDGTFHLDAVITPPITVNLPKWERVPAGTGVDNRIFDSTGAVYWSQEVDYADLEIPVVGASAMAAAAQASRLYDYNGPAFQGVLSISVPVPFGNFQSPPLVKFQGGDVNATTGIPDPDFVAAQGRALVNANGQVTEILLEEPGAFYHSSPTLLLNNVDFNSSVTISMGRTIVSWVSVSTTGSGGLGVVGGAGSHVTAPSSSGVMAHELGHNFGLWHSNRYESQGLRPNSDEGETIDYGNPYSLMGGGGITGDLTISSKVFLQDMGHFGLRGGTGDSNATDVAHLHGPDAVENSGLKETNATNPNTFRIYRHNYGSAPYELRTGSFTVVIPSSSLPPGLSSKLPLGLLIGGPGEGAAGTLESNGSGMQLIIGVAGKGYSEEPVVRVLDSDNQTVLLTIDPSWIVERSGTSPSSYVQVALRNFSATAKRGLRGVEIPASAYAPLGPDAQTPFASYWVSYRVLEGIPKHGLSIINGTTQGFGTSENALIDTTPYTQRDFTDAFLMVGRTYSDYEADSHITPVRRGGIEPMVYIDTVVNVGTVAKGLAKAPNFKLQISDLSPGVNEAVDITVLPLDVNVSDYAYAWYQNEIGMEDIRYLNQRSISKKFSSPGQQVIKVVVSDMKGGISSENVVIRVGDSSKVSSSLVSGQVRSTKGPIQGAKVLLSKASVIEHTVSAAGSLQDSRIPSYSSTPMRFIVDNEAGKQLIFHRGEIHRFYMDSSTDGYPLSFFEHPDHEPAQVKLNLLLTPLVDFAGSGYKEPPAVTLVGGSLFDTHFSTSVTTLFDYQNQPYGPSGTLVTMPSAKSLLLDTNVSKVLVRPTASDPATGLYLHYGGTGQNRYNSPTVAVQRSSYWENYSEANATAIAYVDGVGSIQVNSTGSGYPATPEVRVLGAGQEANVTATSRARNNNDSNQKKSQLLNNSVSISDQGILYDPNSTMAVALYPLDPFLYYSFDEDESLFADNTRYKPTSGMNPPISTGLKHYWQMNEENASTYENNVTATPDLTVTTIADPTIRSKWGLKNKAIELQPGDSIQGTSVLPAAAFSLSLWIHTADAGGNPSLSLTLSGGTPFQITVPDAPDPLVVTGFTGLPNGPATGEWAHLVLTDDGTDTKIFLDGKEVGSRTTTLNSPDLAISGTDCLVDEIMVYDRALRPFEIKQLAGRIFVDLSGNKLHGVPMGPGFEMDSTTDAGSVSNAGADAVKKDNLGRAIDLNGSRYLDLASNLKALSALDKGSVSFWMKPSNSSEMTIFSAANVDENNSYYRLFLRDNGTLRQEVLNDGTELCKVSSDASVDLSNGSWHHVVVTISDTGVGYYVDGKSVASVVPAGASNDRAFLTDIDQLNHLAVGYHRTSELNATNFFVGRLDEFQIYKRALSGSEIKYLYDLGNDLKVDRAILTPSVDAIGTVTVTNAGAGYKEQPEVTFTYASASHYTNQAVGRAELSPVGVDKVLLTKDLYGPVNITLPDDRNVSRRYVEYVRVTAPPNTLYDAQVANGLFGYSAPPDIKIAGSPTWPTDFNATGYPLFFLDPNTSVDIVNGGQGYELSSTRLFHSFAFNGKTYEIIKQRSTWSAAAQLAVVRGGELAEIDDFLEQIVIFGELANAGIGTGETVAPDGGGGAYLWIGGNDFESEGNWTWDGNDDNVTTPFWNGDSTGAPVGVAFNNWGNFFFQSEPDDFGGQQDALALSLNGWPLGLAGQWNDLDQNNQLFFIVEYPVGITPLDIGLGGGFSADAVRIFGEGYRPPQFEASIQAGRIDSLILAKPGEGSFTANTANLLFIGDGLGEVFPQFDNSGNGPFVAGKDIRTNTFSSTAQNNLFDVNGILLDPDADDRGTGWITPPTVFADWGNPAGAWGPDMSNGHVAVSDLDFNATLSEVVVRDPGFRYSIPARVNLFGGQIFDSNSSTVFRPAVVEINGTDAMGGITSYRVVDGGAGYVREPFISITGGGGVGATAFGFVNPFDGNLTAVFPVDPGRGYHNLDAANTPMAKLVFNQPLSSGETNATIRLRLGGALNKPTIVKNNDDPQYIAPWIEIYDRARPNVSAADQAEAVAKVKDGNITKIIVTKSGRGYVDPVVLVRGSAPKLDPYFTDTKRLWMCAHSREDVNGTLHSCGHIHQGDTPPAACPGETPPGPKQTTAQANSNWWDRHSAVCTAFHGPMGGAHVHHRDGSFRKRSCDGIASEYVLINDPYRNPRADWLPFDTNCSAIVQDGKIREIVIDNPGSRYIAPFLEFKGTGGEVDVVPIFDEKGYLIDVFFDDPRIKNLEIDKFDRPFGAGQGFTERPWTKDATFSAAYGPREIIGFDVHSDIAYVDTLLGIRLLLPQTSHTYTTVLPRDSWGDRVVDVEVLKSGVFTQGKDATVSIDFDFNSSFYNDGVPASAIARFTNRLTRMELDHNGTHVWSNYKAADGNARSVSRSTFLAEPKVTIFNETYNAFGVKTQFSSFMEENKTGQIRLNGLVDYDPVSGRSYVDVMVDDRFPNKFYYGLGDSNRSAMGGEILVGEGMPYANWGASEQWGKVAYTDANGYYAVSDLEPGFYNVAVLMEDERYQEMTFRPDSNKSLISRTIFVPGFSDLEIETDRRGRGKSRLVWSTSSQNRGRTASPGSPPDHLKVLEGIGVGFVSGKPVHLSIQPHPSNTSRGSPKVDYSVLVDGSLQLSIIDDQNSSVFDPEDRFTLSFASPINITGINFTEDFRFEDLNHSFWGGSMVAEGKRQLEISPGAGGANNLIEAPIASAGDPNATMAFSVKGYDQNGTQVSPLNPTWSLHFDFNATDGNYSKIASLDTNQSNQVVLTLRSTLKDGNMTLRAEAMIDGNLTVSTVKIIGFQRVPLTEREKWMDLHFHTVLESAVDWTSDDLAKGYDGDGLTNEEEWRYRTNPFLSDTDGDSLADKVEIDATLTNPNAKDTDGDGFIDSLEVDVAGLNPLAFNQAPPSPVFTLLGQQNISTFAGSKVLLGAIVKESSLDGSGTLTNLTVSQDGNFSQVVAYTNGEWIVSPSASTGIYHVVYTVKDSLNRVFSQTQYIQVTALDLKAPIITVSHTGPLYVLKGSPFTLPSYGAYDETDGSLSSSVTVSGADKVDVNKTGTYAVTFSVTDQAGNPGSAVLNVIVEDYAYVIEGKAIDGYLVGSTVIFDAFKNGVLDGVHDLASPVTTDGSGKFVLSLTTPELALFDANNNGKIDYDEGRILVSGGFDVTTNSPFTGSYSSDANSTVISPLSTLVTAVMDDGVGMTKDQAKAKVVQALGLPATIDPTSYDPLAAASSGDADAAKVLLETARLANLMTQADAYASYKGIPFTSPGQAGSTFIKNIADDIGAWTAGDVNPLGDDNKVQQALVSSLRSIQPGASTADVTTAVQLMRTADAVLLQSASTASASNILAVNLAKNQQAIVSEVISGYGTLTNTGNPISTLNVSQLQLQNFSSAISSVNVFPPTAPSFSASIRSGSWKTGSQLSNVLGTDADGDSISYSITSRNFDLDGDGKLPLSVSSAGVLSISDPDDLTPFAASTIEVSVSLSDGKGMSSTVKGNCLVDNLLSLSSAPISGKEGWASSTWLGSFYSAGSSWVYNPLLGWLYVSPDNSNGYWFWDPSLSAWWWTKPETFPHFYRNAVGWSYWNIQGNSRLYYDYNSKSWVTP